MPLNVTEELFSVRNSKVYFMGFEGLVPWLQKGWYIQDNNGFHAIFRSRVYGNLMLCAIKNMEKCGGEYSGKSHGVDSF